MDNEREIENEDEDDGWESASDSDAESNQETDSPPTLQDMIEFHFFGRPGHLQPTKSSRYSWMGSKSCAFKDSRRVPWHIELGPFELARLLHGYTPEIMEDKWFIYAEGPDSSGTAKVNFLRSWTGVKEAELDVRITPVPGDDASVWRGQVVQLTLEREVELDFRVKMATDEEGEVLSGMVVQLPPEEERYGPEQGTLPEDHVKFQVLKACEHVLGIHLGDITEPQAWKKLSKIPAIPPHVAWGKQTTYRGLTLSDNTTEDIERLGGMEEMFIKTSIQFTN